MSIINFFPNVNQNECQNGSNLVLSDKKINIKSPMPKPDFSMIEKKESSFSYKQNGSYKKQKSYIPESPMKSPGQKSFTPVQTISTNYFSTNVSGKKLDFSSMQSDLKTSPIKEESPEYSINSISIKNSDLFGAKNLNSIISNFDIDMQEDDTTSCKYIFHKILFLYRL